jgi:3'-5' exoribonuclease
VHSKEIRQKRTGDPYLSLNLGDRTGDVDARMWDNVGEVMETFSRDDFVRVKGLYHVFQNRPQLTIHKLQRIDDAEIDPADFFPASDRDPEEMFAELREVVAGVGNPHLRGLLEAVLNDGEIARRLRRAPAAKSVHHAYLGGLLEHVLSLCRLCRFTAGHYRHIDLDLLLTGAVLHDVGKIHELSYDRSTGYTTEGQLLGHIHIGLGMIAEKLRAFPEFPPRLRALVEHMILSHHGHLEFGSPKIPVFAEALLLHYLDDMDSKMECIRALEARDKLVSGEWTGYCPPLDRTILKKLRYLAGAEPEDPPATPAAPAEPKRQSLPPPKPVSAFAEKLHGALGEEK